MKCQIKISKQNNQERINLIRRRVTIQVRQVSSLISANLTVVQREKGDGQAAVDSVVALRVYGLGPVRCSVKKKRPVGLISVVGSVRLGLWAWAVRYSIKRKEKPAEGAWDKCRGGRSQRCGGLAPVISLKPSLNEAEGTAENKRKSAVDVNDVSAAKSDEKVKTDTMEEVKQPLVMGKEVQNGGKETEKESRDIAGEEDGKETETQAESEMENARFIMEGGGEAGLARARGRGGPGKVGTIGKGFLCFSLAFLVDRKEKDGFRARDSGIARPCGLVRGGCAGTTTERGEGGAEAERWLGGPGTAMEGVAWRRREGEGEAGRRKETVFFFSYSSTNSGYQTEA